MQKDTRLGAKIKSQMTRFASHLTADWPKTKRRFVSEMIFGIQAGKDIKLSNVARALNEKIRLIKTENRLSRQLADEDFSDRMNKWLCWHGAGAVSEETVLALDPGDVNKRYARKMEHLAEVYDGSQKQVSKGYSLCTIVAADVRGSTVTPLYGELYSSKADTFDSENQQILKAIGMVMAASGKRGIITIDCGGDRRELLHPLLEQHLNFVIRQDGERHIIMPGGMKRAVSDAEKWCKTTIERTIIVEREGEKVEKHLRMGALPVQLPERRGIQLWLVVIRGLSDRPIMLLTNLSPAQRRDFPNWIADIYLTRWKCEEAYRFIKQSYHLEDVRVRSYIALRNIYALVMAVFYFVSVIIGRKTKLNLIFQQVCAKAQRFYETASFIQYAIANGIHRLLFAARGPFTPESPPPPDRQLSFVLSKPPD